jgi:hypothetical protein
MSLVDELMLINRNTVCCERCDRRRHMCNTTRPGLSPRSMGQHPLPWALVCLGRLSTLEAETIGFETQHLNFGGWGHGLEATNKSTRENGNFLKRNSTRLFYS